MIRMSCNGCRVLRKGCSRDCPLRPCLEWIQSPESQANATLFLAKFYGRAGVINLINSGPVHLRPAIFRSLLYEACGRIINPIYGSVGLMTSGNSQRCQAAVEAVLNGAPLTQVDDSTIMPLQGGDIRHLSKTAAAAEAIHRFRTRKRSTARKINNPLHKVAAAAELVKWSTEKFTITGWDYGGGEYHKGFVDHQQDSQSVETVEPALPKPGKTEPRDEDVGLELTLGFNPVRRNILSTVIELSDDSEL